jgi:hypothetical protein
MKSRFAIVRDFREMLDEQSRDDLKRFGGFYLFIKTLDQRSAE